MTINEQELMSSGGSAKVPIAQQIEIGVYAPSVKCALSISQLELTANIEWLDEPVIAVEAAEQPESMQIEREGTMIKVYANGVVGINNPVLSYAMRVFQARLTDARINLHTKKDAVSAKAIQAELEITLHG